MLKVQRAASIIIFNFFAAFPLFAQAPAPDRVPAAPLITHDPYFSVWQFSDKLTEDWSRHWTGRIQAMCAMVRVDGKTARLAGMQPGDVAAMNQVSSKVTNFSTQYQFSADKVECSLTFTSPVLPNDIDLASRPISYITFTVNNRDTVPHEVQYYFDVTGEWVVNSPEQRVQWSRTKLGGESVLRIGSAEQPILQKSGDDLRIDWGYLYLLGVTPGAGDVIQSHATSRATFVNSGAVAASDDLRMPRAANDDYPVMAQSYNFGKIAAGGSGKYIYMLAYDDIHSIEFLGRRLAPYWKHVHGSIEKLLLKARDEATDILTKTGAMDLKLEESVRTMFPGETPVIATLACREAMAAQKIAADFDGTPLMFPKENFSNGCISTVDVIYPASPIFLLLNPKLLKAQLDPVFIYSNSARWKFDFAPHDLGTYPLANGQVYGGCESTEENQMPVEETANMLLMVAGIAKAEGNAQYAIRNWPLLVKWTEYLNKKGLDPENQLCTDDFAGHLAHNANLSIKAILAIGAFGQLCETAGKPADAARWTSTAREMASKWIHLAKDGDHYKLAFDRPGTWSQKYNLVWDSILGLGIFPPELSKTEIEYYKKHINKYGLPLDNRKDYTKTDWLMWTATLTDNPADFLALASPIVQFIRESPDRIPFTDWYDTKSGKCVGFRARPVMGGVYMPMLKNTKTWLEWARAGK